MNGTYGYWPRLVIPEPIHEGPQMVICAWCKPQHIMSDGYQPASHSMCPKAAAELEAEMQEAEEAATVQREQLRGLGVPERADAQGSQGREASDPDHERR